MNVQIFDYRHRLAIRSVLTGLGIGIPTLFLVALKSWGNATVFLAVCGPIALVGAAAMLWRELREPRRFTVRGETIEVSWGQTSRQFNLHDVKISEIRAKSGSIEKAVRVSAGDTSFLIFEGLSDFHHLLAILGHGGDGPPADDQREEPGHGGLA